MDIRKRNSTLDVLRFISILGIIIAHSNPPKWLFEVRNFDVTMMVLIMGASFYISTDGKKEIPYRTYLFKRFKRLILPTWSFLLAFFTIFFILSIINTHEFTFSLTKIIDSFTTFGGIGYVWIMRVFFIVALASPLIKKASNKFSNHLIYFGLLIILYIVYEGLIDLGNSYLSGAMHVYYTEILMYGIGYILVAAVGMRVVQLKRKELMYLALVTSAIFITIGVLMNFPSLQGYKYPPTMYYLTYGLSVSSISYLVMDTETIGSILVNRYTLFISRASLNIYFGHIIAIYLLRLYAENTVLDSNFIIEFTFIFSVGLLLTWVYAIIYRGFKKIS